MSQCDFRVFGLATRAAVANEAEDSSAVKGDAMAAIKQAVCTGARDLRALTQVRPIPSPPVSCTAGLVALMAEHDNAEQASGQYARACGARTRVRRACLRRAQRACATPLPQVGAKWQGAARVDSATSPFCLPAMQRQPLSMVTRCARLHWAHTVWVVAHSTDLSP